jgi:hypothetical protein
MDRNGIPSRIAGDNIRDYKKYLEIQKMNNGANSNNFTNQNNNNINNNNLNGNNSTNQVNNPMNITANSNNNRVPFVITPMKRPPTGDSTQNTRLNNRTMSQTSKNINLNENFILDDINNNNMDNNHIYQEINNLKIMISKSLKNQTEMQNKIIEYNKIINEQENIIRLNNLKLNEHDNKLTEILLSFNNYIQLNEKTSIIINDFQKKLDNCVNNTDFTDLKSTMYNLNKVNESKINEMSSIYEDMNNKLTEMGKENENYQKFTLEKIKTIQKDSMETRLQQQNELIKMEDSKENRINAQFSQIKNLLTLSDKNIKEETEFRKNMINDLRNEILNIFAQKDDQICKLEKTQLETEKNLISLNKDYITSFNELINKHNEKYNYELKSIRSLIEAGLTKVDIKMEKDLKVYEENLTILKSNILEQKTNIANLDTFIKDSINEIENKMEVSKGANSDYFNKFDLLSSSFNQFMKECLNTIEKNKTETENKLMEIIEKKIGEVNLKIKNNSEANDKHFNDLESKITDMQNLINNINLRKVDYQLNDNNNEQKNSNTFLVSELVQKICDDNIIPLKEFINNLQKELINSMNNKIEESKKNFSLTESKNIENIKKMVSDEAGAVESKIMEKVGEDHTLLLGEVEKVVVNAEHRIKQKYDTEIKKLEEDLESLTIKVGLGP